MTPPEHLRALLAEPGLVVMPAVWDGLTARLTAKAGFKTAFLSGSCVAASRLGGPRSRPVVVRRNVRFLQPGARGRARPADFGRCRSWLRKCDERSAHRSRLWPGRRGCNPDRGQDHAARPDGGRQTDPAAQGSAHENPRRSRGRAGFRHPGHGAHRLPPDFGYRRSGRAHRDVCRGKVPISCSSTRRSTTTKSAAPWPPPRAAPHLPSCLPVRRAPVRRRTKRWCLASRSAPIRRACCHRPWLASGPVWPPSSAGEAEADSALEPADLRVTLGYTDYEEKAKQFTLPD